jgi:hypothetical protein
VGPRAVSGQVQKILPPHQDSSPDHPALCHSLYRLSYPAHHYLWSNNPEEHGSHCLGGGSLKSHIVSDILSFMLECSDFPGHSDRLQLHYPLFQQLLFIIDSPTLKTVR